MKFVLAGLMALAMSTVSVPAFAKGTAKCSCTKECAEKCAKGEGKESCKCKACDCATTGKCPHGKCHHAEGEHAEEKK